jgi:pimeloyl-ACP methyl ester carboxylesterase
MTTIHHLIRVLLACLGMSGLPCTVQAEIMVLIHGYLGSSYDWRVSGMSDTLHKNGWQDGGDLVLDAQGVHGYRSTFAGARFYTVAMTSESSLLTQSHDLSRYLDFLRARYPRDSLYLIGHSAGGVVARLTMVRNPHLPVTALITIAAPHLGTPSADLALATVDSPLGEFMPLLGTDVFNRSRALFLDLLPERRGNFLYQLNRQPHPDSRYFSMVRTDSESTPGDLIVPADSQDMNNVSALRGRSETVRAPGLHGLSDADAAQVLELIRRTRSL